MHRFFSSENFLVGSSVSLSKEESMHLARVLRVEEGEEVSLFDGAGKVARARVQVASASRSVVLIESVEETARKSRIHVVFAISKTQALDFIVHRTTEIGVASLTPIVTQHSLAKNYWNSERWQKVVTEVCKQCQAAYLPTLCAPLPFNDWLAQRDKARLLFFCDEEERSAKPTFLFQGAEVDLVVGAEGGWSHEERKRIAQESPAFLGLGTNRLRAETAALVAAVLAKKYIGEIP